MLHLKVYLKMHVTDST